MENEIAIGILLLFSTILMVTGGSLYCGEVFLRYSHIPYQKRLVLLTGFSLFPAVLAIMGYLKVWMIPYVPNLVGLACISYAVFWISKNVDLAYLKRKDLALFIVPIIAILYLVILKINYIWGGPLSHMDEGRSILFISGLANNFLSPAFPTIYSIPVMYPFYLFETGAFLYLATSGIGYPTNPLLVITIWALALGYLALYESCTKFCTKPKKVFLYASAVITTSGLAIYQPRILLDTVHPFMLGQMTGLFGAGYHYFFGICMAVMGVAYFIEFLKTSKKHNFILAVFGIVTCFGFAGIPAAWAGFSIIVIFLVWLPVGKISTAKGLSAKAAIVALFMLGPQLFSFMPALTPLFGFTLPHWLLIRPFVDVVNKTPLPDILWQPLIGPLTILVAVGPILAFSFLILPFIVIRKNFLAWAVVSSVLLLSITETWGPDWFGRRPLFAIVLSGILISIFIENKSRTIKTLFISILVAQTLYYIPLPILHFQRALPVVSTIHNGLKIGTLFFTPEYNQLAENTLLAGRGVLTAPSEAHEAYLPNKTILNRMGIPLKITVCSKNAFGKTIPRGVFVIIKEDKMHEYRCDEIIE